MLYEPEVWRVRSRKLVMIFSLVCYVALALALLFLPDFRQEKFLTGAYIGQEGDYIQLKLYAGDTIYVKANKLPKLPKLRLGDTIVVHYYHDQFTFLPYYNNIISIHRSAEADWGISLDTADVTPTGMRLLIGVDSEYSRDLTFSAYTLETLSGISWKPLSNQSVSHTPTLLSDGGSAQLHWESVYGALESGMYRVCATVSCKGENRNLFAEFTIPCPLPTTLEDALEQSVYYSLSKQIIDPPKRSFYPERIDPERGWGLLSDPLTFSTVGEIYDRICYSYEVYAYEQAGDLHTFKILGLCRGYRYWTPVKEFGAPIWLTIQEMEDGTFDAISCKIPFDIFEMSSAPAFPPEISTEVAVTKTQFNALRIACDAQVFGSVTSPEPIQTIPYICLEENSPETKTFLQAIASGTQAMPTDFKDVDWTVYIDDATYYIKQQANHDSETYTLIVYHYNDGLYTQLTEEDSKKVTMLYINAAAVS